MLLAPFRYALLMFFYVAMATLAAQGRPMVIAFAFVVGAWAVCIPVRCLFDLPDSEV